VLSIAVSVVKEPGLVPASKLPLVPTANAVAALPKSNAVTAPPTKNFFNLFIKIFSPPFHEKNSLKI
jgi:hypothetical protein